MIVRCVKNEYLFASNRAFVLRRQPNDCLDDDVIVVGRWYTISDSKNVGYPLTVGQEYTVYGIMQYDGHLFYLLEDDDAWANFIPHELVEIIKCDVPWEWRVNCFNLWTGPLLIIGYEGIANSYDELCDLIERDKTAVRKFLDNKYWLREWIGYD